jgi:hypothetical protein
MNVIVSVLIMTIFVVIPLVIGFRGEGTKNNVLWVAVGGIGIWLLWLTMGWQ